MLSCFSGVELMLGSSTGFVRGLDEPQDPLLYI